MMKVVVCCLIVILVIVLSVQGIKPSTRQSKGQTATAKKKPAPRLNFELLPKLQSLLDEMELKHLIRSLVAMGVSETHHLLRLSDMDFQLMMMEGQITDTEIRAIKQRVKVLIELATLPEEEPEKPEYALRRKLKYGKVYLDGSVQSFEFVTASFGGPPFIGGRHFVFPDPPVGCDLESYDGHSDLSNEIVVVQRGVCSYLQKALIAQKFKSSALLIVNTLDELESPSSGLGVDLSVKKHVVESVDSLFVAGLSSTAWAKLVFASKHQNQPLLHIVPLSCPHASKCAPIVDEEKRLVEEVTNGRVVFERSRGKSKSCDFLSSAFGSVLPPSSQSLAVHFSQPLDGCSTINAPVFDQSKASPSFALVTHRGNCRFDTKALQVQRTGAVLQIIVDDQDGPLQRVGGRPPEVTDVSIPSIMISKSCLNWIESDQGASGTSQVSVTVHPRATSTLAEKWTNLTFFSWAGNTQAMRGQLKALRDEFAADDASRVEPENTEIIEWIERKLSRLPTEVEVSVQ